MIHFKVGGQVVQLNSNVPTSYLNTIHTFCLSSTYAEILAVVYFNSIRGSAGCCYESSWPATGSDNNRVSCRSNDVGKANSPVLFGCIEANDITRLYAQLQA